MYVVKLIVGRGGGGDYVHIVKFMGGGGGVHVAEFKGGLSPPTGDFVRGGGEERLM